MNVRVADIHCTHEEWSAPGAGFVTEPWDNPGYELRCSVRDPNGRVIEVGQATGMLRFMGIED